MTLSLSLGCSPLSHLPRVNTSGIRTRISSDTLRLDVSWPIADLGVNQSSSQSKARVLRIACGGDGYMVWINAGTDLQRIIVTDQNWLPKALADGNRDRVVAIRFRHPELQREDGSGAQHWTSFNLFGN